VKRRTCLLLLAVVGCADRRTAVIDAFPIGSQAEPWQLVGDVWTGVFDEAAGALGHDAERWRQLAPTRVWLAVYTHALHPARVVKVRCFAFEHDEAAHAAYYAFAPVLAPNYTAGDEGCWTEIGVLFRWGRLVLDVFGDRDTWACQTQASYVAAVLIRQMPPAAPARGE
jgi:hypothetical protein